MCRRPRSIRASSGFSRKREASTSDINKRQSMSLTKRRLRQRAISKPMFPQTSLHSALKRLGFVQADPIRSPARAQDLILRHRVKGYRAGDLETRYAKLELE